jgi:very-short-patch-repair endonuclease
MLAIEIDGSSHEIEGAYEKDQQRQQRLESLGVSFLRFDDLMVKQDIWHVLGIIEYWTETYEQRYGS